MKIGIIGSGVVGQTIGTKLVELGHEVKIGTRDPARLEEWRGKLGQRASAGSFDEAAQFGETLFHCALGSAALDILRSAGEGNLAGKTLVDISNPLDSSQGMPPPLFVCNTDSLGEQIQQAFPRARVVKSLNMVTAKVMVEPSLAGNPDMFLCGNDAEAKDQVAQILEEWFGWKRVIDLGDISGARAMEMLMPMWLRLWGVLGTPLIGFKITE